MTVLTFVIVTCAPATDLSTPTQSELVSTVSPTKTVASETPSSTPQPSYSTLPGTDVPILDHVYLNDHRELYYQITDSVAKFTRAMKMVELEVTDQQILDALNDPKNYETKLAPDGKIYTQFKYTVDVEERSHSFGMVYTQEKGWSTHFNDILRVKGIDFASRAEPKGMEQQVARSTITEVVLEMGDREIFSEYFDWSKITTDWDNIENQLRQGIIPYENEVFNQVNLNDALGQMDFAVKNGLKFRGDTLFYPNMIMDVDDFKGQYEYIKRLPPEDQVKAIKFMSAAKVLKLDKMPLIDLGGELAAFQVWWDDNFNIPFAKLGGVNFLADLGNFVIEVRGDNKLELVYTEDSIIDNVSGNEKHALHYRKFFEMLKALKQSGAPVKYVDLENGGWIGIPPTEETINQPIKEIQALGFEIESPETIVATGDTNPIWTNWPQTTEVSDTEAGKLIQQGDVYYLIFKTYLDNGIPNLGTHSLTDHEDWLQSRSDLFDIGGNPKPAFFRIQDLILNY
jgi:GH35 family endo-1,4-beta-xylanase